MVNYVAKCFFFIVNLNIQLKSAIFDWFSVFLIMNVSALFYFADKREISPKIEWLWQAHVCLFIKCTCLSSDTSTPFGFTLKRGFKETESTRSLGVGEGSKFHPPLTFYTESQKIWPSLSNIFHLALLHYDTFYNIQRFCLVYV